MTDRHCTKSQVLYNRSCSFTSAPILRYLLRIYVDGNQYTNVQDCIGMLYVLYVQFFLIDYFDFIFVLFYFFISRLLFDVIYVVIYMLVLYIYLFIHLLIDLFLFSIFFLFIYLSVLFFYFPV